MTDRDPYDGQPYYCVMCGAGYAEYIACEEPDCRLEASEKAIARAARRRPVGSDSFDAAKRYKDGG